MVNTKEGTFKTGNIAGTILSFLQKSPPDSETKFLAINKEAMPYLKKKTKKAAWFKGLFNQTAHQEYVEAKTAIKILHKEEQKLHQIKDLSPKINHLLGKRELTAAQKEALHEFLWRHPDQIQPFFDYLEAVENLREKNLALLEQGKLIAPDKDFSKMNGKAIAIFAETDNEQQKQCIGSILWSLEESACVTNTQINADSLAECLYPHDNQPVGAPKRFASTIDAIEEERKKKIVELAKKANIPVTFEDKDPRVANRKALDTLAGKIQDPEIAHMRHMIGFHPRARVPLLQKAEWIEETFSQGGFKGTHVITFRDGEIEKEAKASLDLTVAQIRPNQLKEAFAFAAALDRAYVLADSRQWLNENRDTIAQNEMPKAFPTEVKKVLDEYKTKFSDDQLNALFLKFTNFYCDIHLEMFKAIMTLGNE